MKPIIGYISLFVVVASFSAVTYLPAHIVVNHLPLPSQLVLQGVQGTIWNGQAKQVQWQQYSLGEVQWRWQWSALFKAQTQVAVRFGRGSDVQLQGKGMVGYGLSGPFIQQLVVSLPAQKVQPYLTLPIPLDLQGQVELTVHDYHYQAPWCKQGSGVIAWTQSEVGTPLGTLELGPVIADISCQQNVLTMNGSQQNEQMSSEFSIELQADRRFSSQAWFKPGVDFPTTLSQQLQYLPTPDSQGRYSLTQKGYF